MAPRPGRRPAPSVRPMIAWHKVGWFAGTGATLVTAFLVYAFVSEPILERCTGGTASSVGAAAVIGCVVLAAAAFSLSRLRWRLWLSFFGFAGGYVLLLLVLADVAPL